MLASLAVLHRPAAVMLASKVLERDQTSLFERVGGMRHALLRRGMRVGLAGRRVSVVRAGVAGWMRACVCARVSRTCVQQVPLRAQ